MEIKKVSLDIESHYGHSKYEGLCNYLRKMQIGTAIEVILDNPNSTLSTTLGQVFRRKRYNFKIKTRKRDEKGKKWYIAKIPRKEKEVSQ